MPDEELDDVEVEEAHAEPDSDAASEPAENELPDDPEALKERLKAAEAEKVEAKREAARAARKAERLEEGIKEQKVKADYWAKEAQKQQGQKAPAAETRNGDAKPSTDSQIKKALGGKELADYVAEENGLELLVDDLAEAGVIVTPKRLEAILNQRDDQNRKATNLFGSLTQRFPDLNDTDSELAQETTRRAQTLIEDEGMDGPAAYRIAAAEAALDLGIAPKSKAPAKPSTTNGTNSNRLRNAQGGPPARSSQQPAKIVVPEADIQGAMKMGLTREQAIKSQTNLIRQRRQYEASQGHRA